MSKLCAVINPQALQPGDVILTTHTFSPTSFMIRKGTKCAYSHAIIVVDPTSVFEAIGLGVHAQNTLRLRYRNTNEIRVLRYQGLQKDQIRDIILYLRTHYAMAYSTWDAIKSALYCFVGHKIRIKMNTRKTFCSQFVAKAYAKAGICINGKNPEFIRPKDIDLDKKFIDVPNAILTIPQKKVTGPNFIKMQDNIVCPMMRKIWKILKKYGVEIKGEPEIFRGISLIDDPNKRLTADRKIAAVILKSGYLTNWKNEYDACPENHVFRDFYAKYEKEPNFKGLALNKLRFWEQDAIRRQQNLSTMEICNQINPSQYKPLISAYLYIQLERRLLINATEAIQEFQNGLYKVLHGFSV